MTVESAARTRVHYPHALGVSYTPMTVAKAYHYPTTFTGKGFVGGIIELGGAVNTGDLNKYGLTSVVTVVDVGSGRPVSDGASGADGEVMLDVEVAASVAPGASYRVYFADNTDDGFLAAIQQAVDECHAVSISWGGPENAWDATTMHRFDAVFAAARAKGVPVFVASGDTGSADSGGKGSHVDFPASSPNVVGCGGTQLRVDSSGERVTEVTWDDNDTESATGGGTSAVFLGRNVPDVAGNASPYTGYRVIVDGQAGVIGGTSAVAPLYLGLHLLLLEARGGASFDWLQVIPANPGVCFDVTSGDNGAFRAGPGRDQTTGFGVVDGARLLAVLGAAAPVEPPVTVPVTPPSTPVTPPAPVVDDAALLAAFAADPRIRRWLTSRHTGDNAYASAAVAALLAKAGVS